MRVASKPPRRGQAPVGSVADARSPWMPSRRAVTLAPPDADGGNVADAITRRGAGKEDERSWRRGRESSGF